MASDENEQKEPASRTVPTGVNGPRHPDGKFARGNKLARGNPLNRRAQMLRVQAVRFMDRKKLWDVLDMLHTQAVEMKNIQAAKELLDRTLGKPKQEMDINSAGDGAAIPAFIQLIQSLKQHSPSSDEPENNE